MHAESSSCGKMHRNIAGRYPALDKRLRVFFLLLLLPVGSYYSTQRGAVPMPDKEEPNGPRRSAALAFRLCLLCGKRPVNLAVFIHRPLRCDLLPEACRNANRIRTPRASCFFVFCFFFTVNSRRPRNKRSPVARAEISIKEKKKVNDFFSFCIPSFFPYYTCFQIFFSIPDSGGAGKKKKSNKTKPQTARDAAVCMPSR